MAERWSSTTACRLNEGVASPSPIAGEWCGVSYKAFLDFVLDRNDLDYCTVDIDYGCGVIFQAQHY